jgi:hypothetical protein
MRWWEASSAAGKRVIFTTTAAHPAALADVFPLIMKMWLDTAFGPV